MSGLTPSPSTSPASPPSGQELLIVSSGAIALGRRVLKLPRGTLKLEESQAAAAVGQVALARAWAETLHRHGFTAGQMLLTLDDTEERRRYLNARSTIATLLRLGAVPVINENDTVATTRDPLRRQRPPRRARRHDDQRRSARPALRCRRPLFGPPKIRSRRPSPAAGRARSPPRSRRWPAAPAPSCRAAAC